MAKITTYTKLQTVVTKLNSQISVFEAHGLLTGMLSLARLQPEETWRRALIETMDCVQPSKQQWNVISAVARQIVESFSDLKFSFDLLLPDDAEPLEQRIDALGCWCRGYLIGLGLVGLTAQDLKNDVIKELIGDLSHVAHISIETDSSEEDEHNYMELVEFVRIAVQNVQLELKELDQGQMLH